jgi:branched-subunit amino acid aminotransferase/4-amino-4-deoxychorismate lyase
VDAVLRVEIDGREPTAERLLAGRLGNYGHFTAMQVRDGRVRGLADHLRRLDEGHRELYGSGLDGDHVRGLVAHALRGIPDASVRVVAFGVDEPSLMVAVDRPWAGSEAPQSLRSVDYQRPLPHVKHLGGFGQLLHGRRARAAGFDDALLTTSDGVVIEGAIANIAFLDGTGIVWAQADWLHGTTMRLLERQLPSRRAVVRLEDLPDYRGAFVANSLGVFAVSRVDAVEFAVDGREIAEVRAAYDAVPWDAFS